MLLDTAMLLLLLVFLLRIALLLAVFMLNLVELGDTFILPETALPADRALFTFDVEILLDPAGVVF